MVEWISSAQGLVGEHLHALASTIEEAAITPRGQGKGDDDTSLLPFPLGISTSLGSSLTSNPHEFGPPVQVFALAFTRLPHLPLRWG